MQNTEQGVVGQWCRVIEKGKLKSEKVENEK